MKTKTTKDWWVSLKVTEKEHIATKIAKREVFYPECTEVWDSLDSETQDRIRKHCEEKHDFNPIDIGEGNPYGD